MDNGGNRSGIDPRSFSYNLHIPERRSGRDRRSGKDRRTGLDRRTDNGTSFNDDRRSGIERRNAFKNLNAQ